MEAFIGEVRPFAFPFAPKYWASCNGQTVPISQYGALFALIGTTFGGDGRTSFGLPNLNGQLAVGAGQGTGLSNWYLGQTQGSTAVTLTTATMAGHTHILNATSTGANSRSGVGNQLALASVEGPNESSIDALIYAVGAQAGTQLAGQSLSMAGGGGSHGNMMPSQVLNYCICLMGVYPYFP